MSDCWKYLDQMASLFNQANEKHSKITANAVKAMYICSRDSIWNVGDRIWDNLKNTSENASSYSKAYDSVGNYVLTKNKIRLVSQTSDGLYLYRPAEEASMSTGTSVKSLIELIGLLTSKLFTTLVDANPDLPHKIKTSLDITLLRQANLIDALVHQGTTLFLNECSQSAFSRFASRVQRVCDLDFFGLELTLDEHTLSDRMRGINQASMPSHSQSNYLIERISISFKDQVLELALGSELIFKMQILFRFYLSLYYTLSRFEDLWFKEKRKKRSAQYFIIVQLFKRLCSVVMINPSVCTTIYLEFESAGDWRTHLSDVLHDAFKKTLLSNSKAADSYSSIINCSLKILSNTDNSGDFEITNLFKEVSHMISNWKFLSLKGDAYADCLLQNIDHQFFEINKA